MVVFGTLVGCLASVFPGAVIFGREWLQKRLEAGAAFEWLVLTAEALTGLFAGILLDLFYSGPFGFYTLLFINIGYFNGICTQYYYEDYINLPLVMSLVNELIYNLYIYVFRFLIRNRLDFLYYAKEIIIPELIFTVVTTLLIYRFFLSANRRLDELDNRREREY